MILVAQKRLSVFLSHLFLQPVRAKIITPRENAGFAERPHRGHNTSRA